MMKKFTLYGWNLSYYTGKLLCYMTHKGVPFEFKKVNLFTLTGSIKKRFRTIVMPVVVTPKGEWLQDTSDIIDMFETSHADNSMVPDSPVQKFAAYLLETWADENWIPVSLMARWKHPENYAAFQAEAGPALLPWFPKFIQNKAIAKIASGLKGYLPALGVTPEQCPQLERETLAYLDALDTHFAKHRYLLGDRPSLADFGLAGPIVAHLAYDPWPTREWIAPRKHLSAWVERISQKDNTHDLQWMQDDTLPETLAPIMDAISTDFLKTIAATLDKTRYVAARLAEGKMLPRSISNITIPKAGGNYTCNASPFALWKMQRIQNVYKAMPKKDQQAVRTWLAGFGAEGFIDLEIPEMERSGLRVKFV